MLENPRSRRSRFQLSRTAYQMKAERCNKMESELLRQRMRLMDNDLHRYNGTVYKEKRKLSRLMEETRQSTGHAPVGIMPEGKKDMVMISKSPWFKEGQTRLSEKHLNKWRTTESELNRIYNISPTQKEEMTQREKNKRMALAHFLKTAGLLDKKTKQSLLGLAPHGASNATSDTEEDDSLAKDDDLSKLDKIKTNFPRVFAYCKNDAMRMRSAPGSRLTLEEQFADLHVQRRTYTAGTSRSKRPFTVQRRVHGDRTTQRRSTAFTSDPLNEEPEETAAEMQRHHLLSDVTEGDRIDIEGEDDAFEVFASLPQWKRELLMEAPMFVNSTTTENSAENVKAILSKSQIRRDLEEMRNENSKRTRLLHACNLKKVYLQ